MFLKCIIGRKKKYKEKIGFNAQSTGPKLLLFRIIAGPQLAIKVRYASGFTQLNKSAGKDLSDTLVHYRRSVTVAFPFPFIKAKATNPSSLPHSLLSN